MYGFLICDRLLLWVEVATEPKNNKRIRNMFEVLGVEVNLEEAVNDMVEVGPTPDRVVEVTGMCRHITA